ncbi:MAG: Stk1 family PASTA domain-containing Ser/Thr kinase [Ruminococcaceae bacterium]|nr:Stk1 family PASTA domain-containing Ser/Thr kinase [Oscillospiraceae bacterium]
MEQHSMDRYLGQMLDGRYEILETIGVGGMAVVYKARCHLLNRYVAIKILRDDMAADEEFRAHFQKEAQAVAMLSHTNIVSVYDVSRSPELNYIVMELIEGVTLKLYMKSRGRLKIKEGVHFAVQIARALSHAHSKGIVHRDIKPQNMMLCMDGSIKVADFGIAYLESTQAVERSTAVGSVHYISPEQARGQVVDARTDIYSLGVVMYEMFTGRLPYVGDSAEAVALQHVSAAPVSPDVVNPELPAELARITLKAMNADIDQRYQSVDELLKDLEEYRLSATESIAAVKPARAPEKPERTAPAEGDVMPISRSGELSKEKYIRRHRRANKVSLLTGFVLVFVFAICVFITLWNYFLKDIFADTVRINVPNFVGSNREDIINNREFQSIYNFTVVYTVDPETPADVIISQTPASGRSVMKDAAGIDVELKVSTGIQMLQIPNVVNKEFRDAQMMLQKAGFLVELDYKTSETVTRDYVIATNPEAGDSIPAGATVYMTVSGGPNIATVEMPSLVGLTRAVAVSRIESANLSLGTITYVDSDVPEGTVIWQSTKAYTVVDEHTKIYLQVSSGPKETEPPEESAVPEEGDAEPVAPDVPSANSQVGEADAPAQE